MKLDIPDDDRVQLKQWLADSPDAEKLFGALEKVEPALRRADLVARVSAETGFAEEVVTHAIEALLRMVRSRASVRTDSERLAFKQAVVSEIVGPASGVEFRQQVGARLDRIFGAQSIRVTGKALDVMLSNPNRFCEARTLSEIRPVFHDDSLEAEATVVLHQLKIVYHTHPRFERAEIYVAMTRQDLQDLLEVIQRAMKKHDALSDICRKSDLPLLAEK